MQDVLRAVVSFVSKAQMVKCTLKYIRIPFAAKIGRHVYNYHNPHGIALLAIEILYIHYQCVLSWFPNVDRKLKIIL